MRRTRCSDCFGTCELAGHLRSGMQIMRCQSCGMCYYGKKTKVLKK